jgi:hypothetical protein
MPNEFIALPKHAHSLIVEAIRSRGITISPFEDTQLKRNRRPGDALYLCQSDGGLLKLLVPAKDEIPSDLGDYTGVVILPHGGLMRRLRHRRADGRLHDAVAAILNELRSIPPTTV